MDKKELEKMMKNAVNIGTDKQAAQQNPIIGLLMGFQQLEMALKQSIENTAMLGRALDISQLSTRMLARMLIEKGILTEQELEERYQKDVIDTYKEMEAEAIKQIKEEAEKVKEAAEKAEQELKKEETKDNVVPFIKKEEPTNE